MSHGISGIVSMLCFLCHGNVCSCLFVVCVCVCVPGGGGRGARKIRLMLFFFLLRENKWSQKISQFSVYNVVIVSS